MALSSPGAAPGTGAAIAAGDAHQVPLDLAVRLDLAGLLRVRGATAAVLHGDLDALILVQRLVAGGVRVREDCSVVAYDDGVAALGSTPLTAVAPPKSAIGRAAGELLLRRLARPANASDPVPGSSCCRS